MTTTVSRIRINFFIKSKDNEQEFSKLQNLVIQVTQRYPVSFRTRANTKEKLLLSISLWASASQTSIFSLCVIMQRENTTCSDEMRDFSLCPQDPVK